MFDWKYVDETLRKSSSNSFFKGLIPCCYKCVSDIVSDIARYFFSQLLKRKQLLGPMDEVEKNIYRNGWRHSGSVCFRLRAGFLRTESVLWSSSSWYCFVSVYPKHRKPGQRQRGARVHRFQMGCLKSEVAGRCVFIPVCVCRCNVHT